MKKYALLLMARKKSMRSRLFFWSIERQVQDFADFFWVGFNEDKEFDDFCYTKKDLEQLEYTWMHDQLMPGHTGYIPLLWYKLNQQYDGIFVVEDDVRMRGNWLLMLKNIAYDGADYVSIDIRPYASEPNWYHWPSVKLKAPANSDIKIELFAAFSPFFYLSKRGFQVVDRFYRAGSVGHYESVIPSAVKSSGLEIKDLSQISGADNKYKSWYNLNSFRYRPNKLCWGRHRDLLYHPCKGYYLYLKDSIFNMGRNSIRLLLKKLI